MPDVRATEFFAGIGLMRLGLEAAGVTTCWANDIEADKRDLYVANFGADEFVLGDVRDIHGADLPRAALATASFPCTDLSLAGKRRGLGDGSGSRTEPGGSSMFWEFARVIDEMGQDRPDVVLLENVLGFASSRNGDDLRDAVLRLNDLGYSCDLFVIDARHFVPQSRPRMFVVGLTQPTPEDEYSPLVDRPEWVHKFAARNPGVRLHTRELPQLPDGPTTLRDVLSSPTDPHVEWWDEDRVGSFLASLSPLQATRLAQLRDAATVTWRTAYRRTRDGQARWEIRRDGIAGCLRTARGGSSKQALVEAGNGRVCVRWMTPREYAALMGAPNFKLRSRRNQALFGFGDAVCVPVVTWICENYLATDLGLANERMAA